MYYNLEKTAEILDCTPGDVNRLREANKLRAFRDGASWKFRKEDVEKYLTDLIRERSKSAAPSAADLLNDSDDEELPTMLADSASFDAMIDATAEKLEIKATAVPEPDFVLDDDVADADLQIVAEPQAESAPLSFDKDEESAFLSFDKDDESAPLSFDKDDESAPLSFDKDEESAPLSFDKDEESASLSFDKDEESASLSFDKDEEDAPLSFDKDEESASLSFDKDEESAPLSFDKDEESASLSFDKDEEDDADFGLALESQDDDLLLADDAPKAETAPEPAAFAPEADVADDDLLLVADDAPKADDDESASVFNFEKDADADALAGASDDDLLHLGSDSGLSLLDDVDLSGSNVSLDGGDVVLGGSGSGSGLHLGSDSGLSLLGDDAEDFALEGVEVQNDAAFAPETDDDDSIFELADEPNPSAVLALEQNANSDTATILG
ncbi:MAG: helix-turn-helix domain-containing protein, partial [Thermoguttaceae bacterium]|nr:helix-turn-helix domain-containing protein [Thermoguttaceae bacterium]